MSQLKRVSAETHSNPLGTEKIGKLMAQFAIPSIISLVVNAVYNLIDQIFIGQGVGYLGNAATNIILPLMTVQIGLGIMLCDGTAAFLSLMLGEGERKKAAKGVANCITLTVILGILLCVLFELFLSPLCHLFGSTESIYTYAMDYGRIIVLGFPVAMINYSMAGVIRADGRPKESMIGMVIGCVTNIVLDYLFVIVLSWGVAGAAWATIIGQFLNALYYIYLMFHFKSVKMEKDDFALNVTIVRKVVSLGLPSFITQIATVVVIFTMNNVIGTVGVNSKYGADIPLAVIGITMKLCMVVTQIALGIAIGAQPIYGFNYGSRQHKRVKETFKLAMISSTLVLVVATVVFEVFPAQIISLFGQESELYMEFAVKCIRTYLGACFVIGMNLVCCIFLQSVGKALPSSVLSLARQIVILVPAIVLLGRFGGVEGILWAGPVSDVLACVISLIMVAAYWKNIFPAKAEKVSEESADKAAAVIKPSRPGVIITIAREHGSSGKQIGKMVAEKRNIPFYYKEMTALAAQESGLAREFISDINKNSPEYLHELYLSTKVVQDAITAQHKVIHKIAENGSCVIVGRSADYVLRDLPNVVRVFVYAPEEYRAGRVMEIYGDTREEAVKNIRRSDEARGAYYRNISGHEWGDRRQYDLLVDSSIGLEKTAELILQFVDARERAV